MTSSIRTLAAIVGIGGLLGILQAAGTLLWYAREGVFQDLIDSGAATMVFGQMALGVFFSGCAVVLAFLILNLPVDKYPGGPK